MLRQPWRKIWERGGGTGESDAENDPTRAPRLRKGDATAPAASLLGPAGSAHAAVCAPASTEKRDESSAQHPDRMTPSALLNLSLKKRQFRFAGKGGSAGAFAAAARGEEEDQHVGADSDAAAAQSRFAHGSVRVKTFFISLIATYPACFSSHVFLHDG